MSDLNSWTVTGRVTKDATFKTLASGKQLLEVSVAVNSGYGQYAKTVFVTCKKWGASGQNVMPYLTKGTLVGASGELGINEWTDNAGKVHTNVEMNVQGLQLLAKASGLERQPDLQGAPEDEPEPVW